MESPLKTKNRVPYDPAVLLLGIYLQETLISKDACAPVFLVALFTIAKTKKQLNVHQQEDRSKKTCYVNTMEYYSTVKKNEVMPLAAT